MNSSQSLQFLLNKGAVLLCLVLGVFSSSLHAQDSMMSSAKSQAKIFYASAPWDGAAYAIEIPLEADKESPQGYLRINIWGNPEFSEITAYSFTGVEDSGGGPGKGIGRASYQAVLNKSSPVALKGDIEFGSLQKDKPVIGIYVLTSLDGKRQFSGHFEAAWGNKSASPTR